MSLQDKAVYCHYHCALLYHKRLCDNEIIISALSQRDFDLSEGCFFFIKS